MTGCGNKGDLYLIPDAVSQQDIEQLQQALDNGEASAAPVGEVDDESIYVKPRKSGGDKTSADPDTVTETPIVD